MPDSRSNPAATIPGGGVAAPVSAPHRRRSRLRGDRAIAVAVLIPSIVAVAIFIYFFIAYTFFVSVVKWPTLLPDYTFVGLDNWIRMFNDDRFRIDMRNLVLYAAGFMTQCIVIGFVLASLLDQKIKSEAVFRTVFIFPFAVSGIVTGVVWRWLMYPPAGLNQLFEAVGLGFLKSKWYTDPTWGILAVIDRGVLAVFGVRDGALPRRAAGHLARAERGGGHRRRQHLAALPAHHHPVAGPGDLHGDRADRHGLDPCVRHPARSWARGPRSAPTFCPSTCSSSRSNRTGSRWAR